MGTKEQPPPLVMADGQTTDEPTEADPPTTVHTPGLVEAVERLGFVTPKAITIALRLEREFSLIPRDNWRPTSDDDLVTRLRKGWWLFESAELRDMQREAADEIDRLRALVGGRSAAPTREQVLEAIYSVRSPEGYVYQALDRERNGQIPGAVADAVVALLSRSAAEPPPGSDLHGEDILFVAGLVIERFVEPGPLRDAARVFASEFVAGGVAAEPNEDQPTAKKGHACPGCGTPAGQCPDDDGLFCCEECPRWFGATDHPAAEPNEEHDDGR